MSDFMKYKLCPSWSFKELADLCCGLCPDYGRKSFEEPDWEQEIKNINWAEEMINRACLTY